MSNAFRPQLCPNEQIDLDKITYPLLASFKLDGIRCIIKGGIIYSRALKELGNGNLSIRFEALRKYSMVHNVILDGELYCTSLSFNDLSGVIRSDNHELPDDLEFWCFDIIDGEDKDFEQRVTQYTNIRAPFFHPVVQKVVNSPAAVAVAFDFALKNGFEGLILRCPKSKYKFGRCTAKSNTAFKVKPYITFDNKIIGVTQATEAREGSEKKINELGYSTTSQKKDDRVLIERAATFVVLHEGKELGVSLAMTNEEKEEIWKNRDSYIGKTIEYKGLVVGSKDVPRHAVMIRYREDK
jgi:DNA ligase-1